MNTARHRLPPSTLPPRADAAEAVHRAAAAAGRQRHSGWTIALHWGTVLALVALVAAVLLREVVEDKALRALLLDAHRQLGLAVGLALVARIGVRLAVGLAETARHLPAPLRLAGAATHWVLYGALAALVALGLALSNAHAVEVKLFGLLPLPLLVGEDADLADTLGDWHLWAAWALLALVLLHAAAALAHHWLLRDRVLSAMLPTVRRRPARR